MEKEADNWFIEVNPGEWADDPDNPQKLDYLADQLKDRELHIIQLLLEKGPDSTRALWNKYCKLQYDIIEESGGEPGVEKISQSDFNNKGEFYDEIRSKLRDNPLTEEPVSYKTFRKEVKHLKELAILNSRPSPQGNTGNYWVVNPKFKELWRERRNNIRKMIEEGEKDPKFFTNRTLNLFYGLSSKKIS